MVSRALKTVNISEEIQKFEGPLHRENEVYVASLETPFVVHTPTVILESPLEDETFANLRLTTSTVALFKDVERSILELALSQKGTWFREDISDETITKSLRSFVDEEAKTVRVRVDENICAFTGSKKKVAVPPVGTRVKAVIELSRITFSKTQFGAVWNLKQVKLVEDAPYLFEEEVVDGLAETINDSILAADNDEDLAADLAE